jgi:hypothetical protein
VAWRFYRQRSGNHHAKQIGDDQRFSQFLDPLLARSEALVTLEVPAQSYDIRPALKLQKIAPQRLRTLGFNEAWLQKQIADDPTLLGLGDLQVIKRERIQASGGRIDFLMADFESDIRYEVEIMLGAVDESHIIRTIEYWDVERQRYPTLQHCAVIVAEEITSRFFNVIRLLNRAVPLVAIQLSAFQINNDVVLQFIRVLDTNEFNPIGDGEEPESAETTRADWETRTKPESLSVVDACRSLVPTTHGEAKLGYNKTHIALTTGGYVFCWFFPRKTASHGMAVERLAVPLQSWVSCSRRFV